MTGTAFPTARSDTSSVSINAPVDVVWTALAQVEDWPRFSPFALAVAATSATTWRVTSPQGEVDLTGHFEATLGLLDHTVTLGDGTRVFIPYRVTPNMAGSELVMTNVKSPGDSDAEYAEQLEWMRAELEGAKRWVEERFAARGVE